MRVQLPRAILAEHKDAADPGGPIMVRYWFAWTPLVVVLAVIPLALPWLGLIALMLFALIALVALVALAWGLVLVPHGARPCREPTPAPPRWHEPGGSAPADGQSESSTDRINAGGRRAAPCKPTLGRRQADMSALGATHGAENGGSRGGATSSRLATHAGVSADSSDCRPRDPDSTQTRLRSIATRSACTDDRRAAASRERRTR